MQKEVGLLQDTASQNNLFRDELVKKHPECDSSKMDEEINDINARLMNSSQKLSDYQGKLEESLVQCGQFSDAVRSLLGWLEETQELVDGQGPIAAADPKVLKAQVMEQKVGNFWC